MVRNRGNHVIFIALNGLFPETIEPIRAAFYGLIPQENIRVWHAPGPVRLREAENTCRHKVAERIREAFLASLQPDVIHISSLFEGEVDDGVTSIGVLGYDIPTVVTLFDLIPLVNPETYLDPAPHYKKHYLETIEYMKKASSWLAISRFTAKEAVKTLKPESTTVINISAACDPVFQKMEISELEKVDLFNTLGIKKPFVMYTGGSDERKNLDRLFRSYAAMPATIRESHQIVIVGKVDTSYLTAIAQSAGLADNELVFTGYVSDDDLAKLYNLCTIFIFPSWYEGFGLPALEAMSCGAAVIASNTSSLPEVLELENAMFDPLSEKEMTDKLVAFLSDDKLRSNVSQHAIEQVKKFSWDNSAQFAISEIESIGQKTFRNTPQPDHDALLSKLIASISAIESIDQHPEELVSIAHSISLSIPENKQKQLFVDISELAQRDSKTGVQRVTRSILKELLDNPPAGYTVAPVYATINDVSYRYARQFTAHFKGVAPCGDDDLITYQSGDIFLGVDLQHHTTRVLAAFLTQIRRQGVMVHFVVYDLLPIHFPYFWPSEHSVHVVHEEWLSVIAQFDGAICISRAVADELSNWLKSKRQERLRPFKISSFHLGADVENSVPSFGLPEDADSVLKLLRSRPTFLMVGTIEPRKCHEQVLSAFDQLWSENEDINLVIVGKTGWLVDKLTSKIQQHEELDRRLFWLEGVSDEYLDKIYAASTCLIAASQGEGFGLPLIEAAQHSLPIIAREIPVFKEVAEDNAYYFSGDNANKLAQDISRWLTLYRSDMHPRSDNMNWLTWKESTAQLVSALELNNTTVRN
jgi:glycosyltransferase involved in cell wall biosynthesis